MTNKIPEPPKGLRRSGRALWRAVLREYDLDQHEVVLLREAGRTADLIDELQATIDRDGIMGQTSQGPRVNPCAAELRQQRIAFARLLTALRIPAGEQDGRDQVRGTMRGVYRIGAA